MRRSGVRIKDLQDLPELDLEEFNALTDLLFEALNCNHSACARILGITRPTWKKWETEPPTWPWWNLVLRQAVKSTLTAMVGRRRSKGAKHRQHIRDCLARVPNNHELINTIEAEAYTLRESEQHLRQLLMRKGMFWDQIRKPANSGGFSIRALQRAAKSMGIVKTSEGYGEDKRSYWRLPNEDDE